MNNYSIEESVYIEDNKGIGNVYIHNSGFKVVHIKNNDNNKAFITGFKTLPQNNMGVAHALEHCILSNSNIYKNDNIFNELSKKTTYNYLNALTYHDRTAYVVASKFEKQFKTQVISYIDGIFDPLLHEDYFCQEVLNKNNYNGKIIYNGVMLNEMKDFFSNIDNEINYEIYKRVYTNSYKYCNFGKPINIKNINFRDVINYYDKNYKIKDAFFYFYGNLDIEFYLKFIDEHYTYKAHEKTNKNVLHENNFIVQNSKIYIEGIEEKYLSIVYELNQSDNYSIVIVDLFIKYIYDEYLKKEFKHITYTLDADMKQASVIFTVKNTDELNIIDLKKVFNNKLLDIKSKFNLSNYKNEIIKMKYYYSAENYGYKPRGVFYGLHLLKGFVHNDKLNIESLKFNEKLEHNISMKHVSEMFDLIFFKNRNISSFEITNSEYLKINNTNFDRVDFNYNNYYYKNIRQEKLFSFIKLQVYGIMCTDIHLEIYKINENLFYINFYVYMVQKKIKEKFLNIVKFNVEIINNSIVFKIKCFKKDFESDNILYYFFNELIIEQLDIINYINEYKAYFIEQIKNNDDIKFSLFYENIQEIQNIYKANINFKDMLNSILKIHKQCINYFEYKCNFGFNFDDTKVDTKKLDGVLNRHKISKINNKHINISKKQAVNIGVIMKTDVNANHYLFNIERNKFNYVYVKIISILLEKEVFHQKLRVENGVYDFGINIINNNIILYTKSDPNIKKTYVVLENCFKSLLEIENLNEKVENAKLQLLIEETDDFNNEWYFDKVSKKIFENIPFIKKEDLNNLDIVKYIKQNLLNLKGSKFSIGNKKSITDAGTIFEIVIQL